MSQGGDRQRELYSEGRENTQGEKPETEVEELFPVVVLRCSGLVLASIQALGWLVILIRMQTFPHP